MEPTETDTPESTASDDYSRTARAHHPLFPEDAIRVGVFFEAPGFDDAPFDDPDFRQNYFDIARTVREKGGVFCIVRNEHTYMGGSLFAGGWVEHNGEFVRTILPIDLDVIWKKDRIRLDRDVPAINHLELDEICNDKWKTYGLFPQHFPVTRIVPSSRRLRKALEEIGAARMVCKPIEGAKGRGVFIGTMEEILKQKHPYPLMIQAFIDSSGGIPGLVEGHHDFRLFIIRGEIAGCYIRTPPKGSMIANVAQGGTEISVPFGRIPEGALEVYRDVDAALGAFETRTYSVDLALDKSGKWLIIEMNNMPGPPAPADTPEYRFFLEKMAVGLLAAAKK